MKKSYILCACHYYRRIQSVKVQAIYSACMAAGVDCMVVPDLCRVSAKHEPVNAEECTILGCQTRAIKTLIGYAADWIDIRSTPTDELLEKLSLPKEFPWKELPEVTLPDKWIPWFPAIDATRCVQCGKCMDFCMFGVYSKPDGKVTVTSPESCKTDCPACARICPANAIIFAKSEEERLNGSLNEPVKPSENDKVALLERLKHRRVPRLFKEE